MKKLVLLIAGALTIIAAGLIFANRGDTATQTDKTTASSTATEESEDSSKGKKACALIPLGDAKKLLGENTTLLDGSGSSNLATTADVAVDNCSYNADGATIGETKQLTIQSHYGDKAAVKQAYENFKKDYPGETIDNLGDAAYFSTEARQVHVIKDSYWLFVGGGSVNSGGDRELEVQAMEIALQKL